MAGTVHMAVKLLLLSLIGTGVDGVDSLISRRYITYLCGKDVCYHVWYLNRRISGQIAIVCNGAMQTSTPQDDDRQCTIQIDDLTEGVVGRHGCLSPDRSPAVAAKSILYPGEKMLLQCVLLTFLEDNHCHTQMQQRVELMWVDETGAQIHGDSQHQIQRQSACEVTLTLTLQRPGQKRFKCQATVDQQIQTSKEVWVRVPERNKGGRGIVVDPEKGNQGGNQDMVGTALAIVGCVVLTGLIAAFAVNRRRANHRMPEEQFNTITTSHAMNEDDMIYADIVLPVNPDSVLVQESETTEYACIRYK
ncbi:uncharacterized protein ACNS7B_002175 [Menidia menidia]